MSSDDEGSDASVSDVEEVEESEEWAAPKPKAKAAQNGASANGGAKGTGKGKARATPAPKAATPSSRDASAVESGGDGGDSSDLDGVVGNATAGAASGRKRAASGGSGGGSSSRTIEETYQKRTQLEHILLRPDTYVGSCERVTQPMWVYDAAENRIVKRPITFTPGLYKIFDEILVNAADNKQRDKSMNRLEVTVDAVAGQLTVWNNGKGVPIAIHKEHKVHVPELVFGQLLTGSNFDDEERKTTGGRNGYGAKLANVFSTEFTVETADAAAGQKYKQTWKNNMRERGEPVIEPYDAEDSEEGAAAGGGDYTCVTFRPEWKRFKMPGGLDEDTAALLAKRVYDSAACMGMADGERVKVTLNNRRLPQKRFKEYISMFEGLEPPLVFEKVGGGRWEVGIAHSDGAFQQVSYVNAVCTVKGGTHVSCIADQVAAGLAKAVAKKNNKDEVKAHHIKNHIAVYVNALIENPAFDSQTKETLTTRQADFGSKPVLSAEALKALEKSPIVEAVVSWAKFKQQQQLGRITKTSKKTARLTGIPKLDDANLAGTPRSQDCTLILTEGDSAKALAVSGLGVVGRDLFGVFPLKGKLLNVRDASMKAVSNNEEVCNIVRIMGLKYGTEYRDTRQLRYGHLMIMTDQDHDGSHIKGLLINFVHHFWPSLLRLPGFLREFITPIVKAVRGTREESFYTLPDFEAWKAAHNEGRGWSTKYYKGLGTSTAKEAKAYFAAIALHQLDFEWEDDRRDADLIDMAFSKKRAEDRKRWLAAMEPGTSVRYDVDAMTYDSFINEELVLFSMADTQRSIPSLIDGLKPSQRKVLFGCFKRKLVNEVKVAQLAGYVSEHAAYHHGEASLNSTIVGMAQTFVGSNNLHLLTPGGQFGTRLMGGKDAASTRYIFTRLEKLARAVFHPDDDPLLKQLEDDGTPIEPSYYVPVLPMVLVNGSQGIGTGWSSDVPNFCPRDVVENLRRRIRGESMVLMQPWYRGFTGEIKPKRTVTTGTKAATAEPSYVSRGVVERVAPDQILITELPVKKWTQDYKAFLEGMLAGAETTADKAAKGAGGKGAKGGKAAGGGGAAAAKGGKKAGPPAKRGAATPAAAKKGAATPAAAGSGAKRGGGKKKAGGGGGDGDGEEDGGGEQEKEKEKEKRLPIKDFRENHTDTTVSFLVTMAEEHLDAIEAAPGGLYKHFKLESSLSTSNMMLFDQDGHIRKYSSPLQIIEDFYALRLDYYGRRKRHLLAKLHDEWRRLDNRVRFVLAVVEKRLEVGNRRRDELLAELDRRGFESMPPEGKGGGTGGGKAGKAGGGGGGGSDSGGSDSEGDDAEGEAKGAKLLARGYDYLLGMKLWSLTTEKVKQLTSELAAKAEELQALRETSPEQLWLRDLDAVEALLDESDAAFSRDAALELKQRGRAQQRQRGGGRGGRKAGRGGGRGGGGGGRGRQQQLDSDLEDSDFENNAAASSRKGGGAAAAAKKGKAAAAAAADAAAVALPASSAAAAAAAAGRSVEITLGETAAGVKVSAAFAAAEAEGSTVMSAAELPYVIKNSSDCDEDGKPIKPAGHWLPPSKAAKEEEDLEGANGGRSTPVANGGSKGKAGKGASTSGRKRKKKGEDSDEESADSGDSEDDEESEASGGEGGGKGGGNKASKKVAVVKREAAPRRGAAAAAAQSLKKAAAAEAAAAPGSDDTDQDGEGEEEEESPEWGAERGGGGGGGGNGGDSDGDEENRPPPSRQRKAAGKAAPAAAAAKQATSKPKKKAKTEEEEEEAAEPAAAAGDEDGAAAAAAAPARAGSSRRGGAAAAARSLKQAAKDAAGSGSDSDAAAATAAAKESGDEVEEAAATKTKAASRRKPAAAAAKALPKAKSKPAAEADVVVLENDSLPAAGAADAVAADEPIVAAAEAAKRHHLASPGEEKEKEEAKEEASKRQPRKRKAEEEEQEDSEDDLILPEWVGTPSQSQSQEVVQVPPLLPPALPAAAMPLAEVAEKTHHATKTAAAAVKVQPTAKRATAPPAAAAAAAPAAAIAAAPRLVPLSLEPASAAAAPARPLAFKPLALSTATSAAAGRPAIASPVAAAAAAATAPARPAASSKAPAAAAAAAAKPAAVAKPAASRLPAAAAARPAAASPAAKTAAAAAPPLPKTASVGSSLSAISSTWSSSPVKPVLPPAKASKPRPLAAVPAAAAAAAGGGGDDDFGFDFGGGGSDPFAFTGKDSPFKLASSAQNVARGGGGGGGSPFKPAAAGGIASLKRKARSSLGGGGGSASGGGGGGAGEGDAPAERFLADKSGPLAKRAKKG